jgi:hypothetical protein
MKSEDRNPKSEGRNPKLAWALDGFRRVVLWYLDFGRFGFPSDFGPRISDLPL